MGIGAGDGKIEDRDGRVARFVAAALPPESDHRAGSIDEAARMLADDPSLARAGFVPAVLTGEIDLVATQLEADPARAVTPVGAPASSPVLFACFSRFLRFDPARAGRIVRVARLLLDYGADPMVMDANGDTAIALAERMGRADAVALMRGRE